MVIMVLNGEDEMRASRIADPATCCFTGCLVCVVLCRQCVGKVLGRYGRPLRISRYFRYL